MTASIGDRICGYPCTVCQREGGQISMTIQHGRLLEFCSIECAKAYLMRPDKLTTNEAKAIEAGGESAGAYLESIGKTDLASLTGDQWAKFCQTLFASTTEALRRQADDCIPF